MKIQWMSPSGARETRIIGEVEITLFNGSRFILSEGFDAFDKSTGEICARTTDGSLVVRPKVSNLVGISVEKI